jgi:uncharacterized membrane protein
MDIEKILYALLKYYILFCVGGTTYIILELLFRGRTSWEMLFAGAICFVLIGAINNFIPWKMKLWKQALIGGIFIITPIEYLFGIIFNQDYHIWDYRNLPLNMSGQICVPFSLLWCLVAIMCILIDDYLRYFIFGEDKPKYCF